MQKNMKENGCLGIKKQIKFLLMIVENLLSIYRSEGIYKIPAME